MKSLLVALLILIGGVVQANTTVLADGSTIDEIGSSTDNNDNFFIKVSGGTRDCNVIFFPLSATGGSDGNRDVHARAYSAALTAFTTGSNVVVTNYVDTGCNNASKIKLTK